MVNFIDCASQKADLSDLMRCRERHRAITMGDVPKGGLFHRRTLNLCLFFRSAEGQMSSENLRRTGAQFDSEGCDACWELSKSALRREAITKKYVNVRC